MHTSQSTVASISQLLDDVGLVYDEEMASLHVGGLATPMVRIDHRADGAHSMFIDRGESYTANGQITAIGKSLTCVAFGEAPLKALWANGDSYPQCASVNGQHLVDEPRHDRCEECPSARINNGCKSKVRIWLCAKVNDQITPMVFILSPTSIAPWMKHKRRLLRSGLPIIGVRTVFSLVDVKRNGYRWAIVNVSIDGLATKEYLQVAKRARQELHSHMQAISVTDYLERGDRPQPA